MHFDSNAADISTGPALNHTEETVDQFKHADASENGYQSRLSGEFLAPLVTLDSELPHTARPMSLEAAIHLAFNNTKAVRSLGAQILSNPNGVQSSLAPAINATDPVFGIDAALSQFDATLSASLLHANNDDVFNKSILGGRTFRRLAD